MVTICTHSGRRDFISACKFECKDTPYRFNAQANPVPISPSAPFLPQAVPFPRAGNTIPKGWEHDSQGLGTQFPRAGNTIPRGWHSMYPRLALRLPAAGNAIARGRQCDCPRPAMRLPRAVAISLPNKKVGDKRLRSAFTSYSFSNGCVDYSVFPSRKSVVEYFTPNGP